MKFVLSTTFLLLTWHLFAQNYVILHVKGTILQKDTRQPLKVGDQLNEESILVFSALDAFAVVMSKEKGRMIANAQQAKKEGTDEFVATFREILLPMKSTTSTAKGKKEDEIISFKDYFGEGNFVIIGNSIKVKVNKEKFPLDNQHFLVLKYDYEGKKINKPIPFENQSITIEKKSIFDNQMKTTAVDKMDLYYYDQTTKDYTKLANFYPLFLDEGQLKKEVGTLITFLKENAAPRDKIKTEVHHYICDLYGKVDENQLNDWLESMLN